MSGADDSVTYTAWVEKIAMATGTTPKMVHATMQQVLGSPPVEAVELATPTKTQHPGQNRAERRRSEALARREGGRTRG